MKPIRMLCTAVMAALFATTTVYAAGLEEFDGEKMLSDLESQLELSGDKRDKLKPALDAKSEELKKSINESIDKGFMQLDELSTELDAASKEAEAKLKEALSSEEMQQLKEYMKKIDADAIQEIRDELVAQLTVFLKLTEDQIAKIKPILEDGFTQLSEILDQLAQEGSKSFEEFKRQYEGLSDDIEQKMQENLDGEQKEKLDMHRDELREDIRTALKLT